MMSNIMTRTSKLMGRACSAARLDGHVFLAQILNVLRRFA
jgi:hypothetical protein